MLSEIEFLSAECYQHREKNKNKLKQTRQHNRCPAHTLTVESHEEPSYDKRYKESEASKIKKRDARSDFKAE